MRSECSHNASEVSDGCGVMIGLRTQPRSICLEAELRIYFLRRPDVTPASSKRAGSAAEGCGPMPPPSHSRTTRASSIANRRAIGMGRLRRPCHKPLEGWPELSRWALRFGRITRADWGHCGEVAELQGRNDGRSGHRGGGPFR